MQKAHVVQPYYSSVCIGPACSVDRITGSLRVYNAFIIKAADKFHPAQNNFFLTCILPTARMHCVARVPTKAIVAQTQSKAVYVRSNAVPARPTAPVVSGSSFVATSVNSSRIVNQCSQQRWQTHATASSSGVTANLPDGVGVVIVDHGSRKKASNEMLVDFGELYQRVTGAQVVEIAHMELAEPTIEQAIGELWELLTMM